MYQSFIAENEKIIKTWTERLDSLLVYNLTINEKLKEQLTEFPIDETNDIVGINFVSLLKHEEFYDFYLIVDLKTLKFYKNYFEQYMFKGQNLFSYWATPVNPMFILTWGLASGASEEVMQELKGASDVASV
jgi:hypothetical protein